MFLLYDHLTIWQVAHETRLATNLEESTATGTHRCPRINYDEPTSIKWSYVSKRRIGAHRRNMLSVGGIASDD